MNWSFTSPGPRAASIEELPQELFLAVFDKLSKRDLLNLRLVSRALTSAASPVVFRNVHLKLCHPPPWPATSWCLFCGYTRPIHSCEINLPNRDFIFDPYTVPGIRSIEHNREKWIPPHKAHCYPASSRWRDSRDTVLINNISAATLSSIRELVISLPEQHDVLGYGTSALHLADYVLPRVMEGGSSLEAVRVQCYLRQDTLHVTLHLLGMLCRLRGFSSVDVHVRVHYQPETFYNGEVVSKCLGVLWGIASLVLLVKADSCHDGFRGDVAALAARSPGIVLDRESLTVGNGVSGCQLCRKGEDFVWFPDRWGSTGDWFPADPGVWASPTKRRRRAKGVSNVYPEAALTDDTCSIEWSQPSY